MLLVLSIEYALTVCVVHVLQRWDQEHYLENLSGYATDCSMIGRSHWDFQKQKDMAALERKYVEGAFGYALNLGQTQPAMEEVILSLEPVVRKVRPHMHSLE